MNRLFPALMALTALLLLSGCTATRAPEAEDYEWQFITAQRMSDGIIVASAPNTPGVPDTAETVRLSCRMQGGTLSLAGENGTSHSGTYRQSHVSPDARQLVITLGESEGMGTIAHTAYADGSSVPTLLLAIEGYALTFHAVDTP